MIGMTEMSSWRASLQLETATEGPVMDEITAVDVDVVLGVRTTRVGPRNDAETDVRPLPGSSAHVGAVSGLSQAGNAECGHGKRKYEAGEANDTRTGLSRLASSVAARDLGWGCVQPTVACRLRIRGLRVVPAGSTTRLRPRSLAGVRACREIVTLVSLVNLTF